MDPTPNHGLTDGLIRPPGSRHRTGGYQTLLGSITDAVTLASSGNPPAVWARLRAAVPARPTAPAAAQPGDDEPLSGRTGAARPLAADYLAVATTGVYAAARYRSPSEARQAVITAAAAAGMTLTDVLGRIASGTWPGLAAFYARYRPGRRHHAVRSDWTKARVFLARHPGRPGRNLVHRSPTSEPNSPRGGPPGRVRSRNSPDEYRWLRTWWSGLRLSTDRWTGRTALAKRIVLRAMGEAAMKDGSRYIAFGVRSLAVATGLDHTTVAAHLRDLREEDEPFIDLIENDRGLAGDLYQLRIPHGVSDRAHRAAWPAGRIHALRPAFRELGLPAAAVYEALEAVPESLSSFEAAQHAGIGRSTTYEALETLAAWNLVTPDGHGRWRIEHTTCLAQLAEAWGILDTVRRQIAHHRTERAAYRRALRIPEDSYVDIVLAEWTGQDQVDRSLSPDPPPDPLNTALDLVERELGAIHLEARLGR